MTFGSKSHSISGKIPVEVTLIGLQDNMFTNQSAFGLNLFGPVINARYGGVQVLWSKSLKMVSESVDPLASHLVHEAKLALVEAQSPRAELPKPTGRWRRS
jgi:hypothetical protein